ncbi:MAG: hypothetical protein R3F25_04875 [Gammaproteobacteria bacterium]
MKVIFLFGTSILLVTLSYLFMKFGLKLNPNYQLIVYWGILPIIYAIFARKFILKNEKVQHGWLPFTAIQFAFMFLINVKLPNILVHGVPFLFVVPFIVGAVFINYFLKPKPNQQD